MALWLVEQRGFSVIPLEPRGKKPATKWLAFQQARPSRANIQAWFLTDPARNLGIVTGAISGLVAVDCDSPDAIAWADEHLPATEMKTITARGQHWFYRHPGVPVSNKAHVRTSVCDLALDVRGDGGYVVGPTSEHESGFVYTCAGAWPPPSELPAFDPAWIANQEEPDVPLPQVERSTDRATLLSRARAYLRHIPPAVQGTGGDAHTYGVCCKLTRGFALTDGEALDVLRPWNQSCVPPWTDVDLREKIANARRYGNEPIGGRRDTPPPGAAPTPAPAPAVSVSPRVLRVYRADDLIAMPPPQEVVEGIVWAGRVSVLVGESAAGKTFVLTDLATAINAGVAWHGRRVTQGSIVYVSFEGDALGLRLLAVREALGRSLDHVYVVRATAPLSPRVTHGDEMPSLGEMIVTDTLTALATELATTGRPPIRLVSVDTVRSSMTGSEDASEYVSAYIRAVRRMIAPLPDAGSLLAHHAGWQDSETKKKRERGSSAWRGNCDATFYLDAESDDDGDDRHREWPLTLRTLKVRDAGRMAPLHLVRHVVETSARDSAGNILTSCVIASDARTTSDRATDAATAHQAREDEHTLKALRFIAKHPDVTSQEQLRIGLGISRGAIRALVARLVENSWVTSPKQRQPYQLTAEGQARVVAGQL
jgi:hypothetical protein